MTSEDLGVKIGSKLERFWSQVVDATKVELEKHEHGVVLQKAVLEVAEKNLEIEHKNFIEV